MQKEWRKKVNKAQIRGILQRTDGASKITAAESYVWKWRRKKERWQSRRKQQVRTHGVNKDCEGGKTAWKKRNIHRLIRQDKGKDVQKQ